MDGYRINLNTTGAYVRAGFSPNSAGKVAYKVLGNFRIKEATAKKQAGIAGELEITYKEVARSYQNIAEGNPPWRATLNGQMRALYGKILRHFWLA